MLFPFWAEFTVWYRVPPSPYRAHNIENKRVKSSLCARSLSLQELQAKSREHGSLWRCVTAYGSTLEPWGMELERGKGFRLHSYWSDSPVGTAQSCADGRVVKDLLL